MKGTMITVPPGNGPVVTTQLNNPPELEDVHGTLGGYLEAVPYFTLIKIGGAYVRCVAFCNEDGKRMNLPYNERAQLLWSDSFYRQTGVLPDPDYLVGPIVILYGDSEFMSEL